MANVNKFVDLHCHLDGSITPEIAKKLANLQQIPLNFKTEQELIDKLCVHDDCQSLIDFLRCFEFPLSLLQTKIGIEEAIYLILKEAQENGIIYSEIRFAPQLHLQKGLSQEEVIISAINGIKKAPIKANLILCCMRGDNNFEDNVLTVELAHKFLVKDGGVVAIDLAGAESLYKTKNYEKLFSLAKQYKIPFTIHAGEADDASSIKDAILFGAKRIGHGINILLNKEVVELSKRKNIFFEMCPTSNCLTHTIDDIKKFPLLSFIEEDLNATINTDDLGIEGTTIKKEFELMEKEFGLTKEQEIKLLLNAVDCAFTTDEVKKDLRKIIKNQ